MVRAVRVCDLTAFRVLDAGRGSKALMYCFHVAPLCWGYLFDGNIMLDSLCPIFDVWLYACVADTLRLPVVV